MTSATSPKSCNLKAKLNFLNVNPRQDAAGLKRYSLRTLSDISTDEEQTEGQTRSQTRVYYENTFKLCPEGKLSVQKLEEIITEVLNKHLENERYDGVKSKGTCESISQEIKDKVKELGVQRYKLVVLAHLGQNKKQGIEISSRCVWSETFDNFASGHFENNSLFAQAVVFAMYYE